MCKFLELEFATPKVFIVTAAMGVVVDAMIRVEEKCHEADRQTDERR